MAQIISFPIVFSLDSAIDLVNQLACENRRSSLVFACREVLRGDLPKGRE